MVLLIFFMNVEKNGVIVVFLEVVGFFERFEKNILDG